MKPYAALLSVCLLTLFAGCASTSHEAGPTRLNYFEARWWDFMDMFELNLGVDSQASLFVAAAVEPVAVGGGLFEGQKIGTDGRLCGIWTEKRAEIGLLVDGFVQYEKLAQAGNDYLRDAYYCPFKNTLLGNGEFYDDWGFTPRIDDHERRLIDLSAEVHLIALGLEVGVSPVEILDFVVGIFGCDVISNDDWESPIILDRSLPFKFKPEEKDDEASVPEPEDDADSTIPVGGE